MFRQACLRGATGNVSSAENQLITAAASFANQQQGFDGGALVHGLIGLLDVI